MTFSMSRTECSLSSQFLGSSNDRLCSYIYGFLFSEDNAIIPM